MERRVHDAVRVFRDRGGDILAVEDSAACFVGVLSRKELLGEGSFAKAA
jgi:predicted transcriptional regulator